MNMKERECLFRILGIIEGAEELGGMPLNVKDKIKRMIETVLEQPPSATNSEDVRSTVSSVVGPVTVSKQSSLWKVDSSSF